MHHRSFWTGLVVITMTVAVSVRIGWSMVRYGSFTEAESFSDSPVDLNLEPSYSESRLVSPNVDASTSTLHEPPLNVLHGLKSDPELLPGDIPVRVPILMYHHIRPILASYSAKDALYSVTPESFDSQMAGLQKAGYTTISPRDLESAIDGKTALPTKSVLLTFDDGYKDHYTQVLPILKKRNMKATYFIITDAYHLGGYMKKNMIKEADESGLVTIADHTRNHPFLAHMSAANRVPEIVDSKKDLEALLGHPVWDFAYPYGSWNQTVAHEVQAAGYTMGFGVRMGSLHASSTRYELRRIRVLNGEDVASLVSRFSKP